MSWMLRFMLGFMILSGSIFASEPESLFDAQANSGTLQTFRVEGLGHPASGTVYPENCLEQGGMPLGGIGTGYLCFDTDGRLGKFTVLNGLPAIPHANSPFFRLELNGKMMELATDKGEGGAVKKVDYFGHFPVVDIRMRLDVPIELECRAFSPVIPGDSRVSNTPVAFFDVTLLNKSESDQNVKLIFGPQGFPVGKIDDYQEGDWSVFQTTHQAASLPKGTFHSYALGVQGGRTENGTAIFEGKLLPGKRQKVSFLLAWNQTWTRESSGRVEKNFYAVRFPDAKAVVTESIAKKESWLKRILASQDVIYASKYPDWLKEQLINVPTAVTKNTVWFAKSRPDDWWDEDGLVLVSESFVTCPLLDTLPCRFFGQWYQLFFFPELQKISLQGTRYFQLQGGEPPFCVGLSYAIRDPRYHCQHTGGSGEYPQMIYHYYLRTGDKQFLKDFWPSAKKSFEFMLSLDVDGDGLIEDHPHNFKTETFPANNPMDQWPFYGVGSYTAGKGLAALACAIRMAEIMGETETAHAWRAIYEKGKKNFDAILWNGSYYKTYVDKPNQRENNACLSMQLSSIWCTGIVGLPDSLPKDKVETALDSIARLNLHASPFGTVNAVYPDGSICYEGGMGSSIWSAGNFIQCNAMAAGAFLYHGRLEEGSTMIKDSLDTIYRGPHPLPWSQPCGLDMKTGGSCFGYDYLDHVICWTYPMLLDGQTIPEACAPGGLIQSILDAAKPVQTSF